MLEKDVISLDDGERRVLEDSFHPQVTPRRMRSIVLSAAVVVFGVILFAIFGAGVVLLAGLTVAVTVVSAAEKFTYGRTMLRYESLIRKLAHRVEELEGVPLTPLAEPGAIGGVRVTKRSETEPPHTMRTGVPDRSSSLRPPASHPNPRTGTG